MRFRGIIILSICLVISLLAIFINPIKLGSWERGNNDNFLGMVLGLDLRGGTHLVYSITSNTGEEPTVDDAEGVRQIIDKRVNEFGVSEANVQLLGTPPNKILVQIPSQSGAQIAFSYSSDDPDLEQIKTQISEAGLEEFQIQKIEDQYIIEYDNLVDQNTIESIRNNLADTFQVKVMINFSPIRLEGKKEGEDLEFPNIEDIKPLLDQSNIDYDELNNKEFGAWEIVLTNFGYGDDNLAEQIMMSLSESKYNLVNLQPSGELNTFVASGGIQSAKRLIGSTAQLEFRVRECGRDKPENLDQNVWDLVKCYDPQYYNEVATGIESKNLTDASPGTVPELAQPVVNIVFDDDGSDIFYEVTDRISRTGDLLAIYLDNEELVSPGADKAISGGRAYIYGKDIDAESCLLYTSPSPRDS